MLRPCRSEELPPGVFFFHRIVFLSHSSSVGGQFDLVVEIPHGQ